MSQSTTPAPAIDPANVDGVIQAVRFELYRENIYGALEILEAAHAARPEPRYTEQMARIRSWLGHLESREAYVAAQEEQYKGLRWKMGLKLLEKRLRMLSGKKTRLREMSRRAMAWARPQTWAMRVAQDWLPRILQPDRAEARR